MVRGVKRRRGKRVGKRELSIPNGMDWDDRRIGGWDG